MVGTGAGLSAKRAGVRVSPVEEDDAEENKEEDDVDGDEEPEEHDEKGGEEENGEGGLAKVTDEEVNTGEAGDDVVVDVDEEKVDDEHSDDALGKTFIIPSIDGDLPIEDEGGEKKSLYQRSSTARCIMDCGTCFSKYLLCLFNFIILIGGCGVLFLGVWMFADKDSLLSFAKTLDESTIPQLEKYSQPEVTTNIAYILMAVGGSMFILSILGYCGALRESRCLLGFYGFLLVVILILEITAAGLAYFYKDRAESEIRGILKETIKDNYSIEPTNENAASTFLNTIMYKLHCCGVDNYKDFQASPAFVSTGLQVPPACCVFTDNNGNATLVDPDCPKNPTLQNSYHLTGCYETIMNQIKEHMNIVIYAVVGLVIIELLSTFLAFCLCKSLEPYDK